MKVCPECQSEYTDEVEFCSNDGMKLRASRDGGEDPMLGRILEGRWIIEEKIGEGGMGSVYKGSQRSVNRKVAIKTLRPSLISSDEFVDRFFREAKIATTINHPNCVTILDFGQTEDDVLYLAMEFLEGMPLSDWLEQDTLPLEQILMVTEQVATALEAAHAQNIIHRDLKPDNVFLQQTTGKDIHAKLLDFGIAKDTGSETQFTRTGQIFGTPNYMSPEQCSGEELDGRSDVYALGCILYEMLCGRPPFDGANSMAILMAQVTETPVPPSQIVAVPPQVEQLTLALLEKDRDDRPASATEVRQLVRQVRYQVGAGPAPTGDIAITGAHRQMLGTMDTVAGGPATPSAPQPAVNLGPMAGANASSQSMDAMPINAWDEPEPTGDGGKSKKGLIALVAILGILLVGGAATAAILLGDRDAPNAESTSTKSEEVAASASDNNETTAEVAAEPETTATLEEASETTPPEETDAVAANEENEENDATTEEVEEVEKNGVDDKEKVAATTKKSSRKKTRRKSTDTKKAEPPKEIGKEDVLPTFEEKEEKKTETKKVEKKKKKDKSDAIVDGLF